jgi:hypothetical protein
MIITLVFEKNANFCQKSAKIAENCDHNIDPNFKKKMDHDSFLKEKRQFIRRNLAENRRKFLSEI